MRWMDFLHREREEMQNKCIIWVGAESERGERRERERGKSHMDLPCTQLQLQTQGVFIKSERIFRRKF